MLPIAALMMLKRISRPGARVTRKGDVCWWWNAGKQGMGCVEKRAKIGTKPPCKQREDAVGGGPQRRSSSQTRRKQIGLAADCNCAQIKFGFWACVAPSPNEVNAEAEWAEFTNLTTSPKQSNRRGTRNPPHATAYRSAPPAPRPRFRLLTFLGFAPFAIHLWFTAVSRGRRRTWEADSAP